MTDRIVTISDMHFGVKDSTLTNPAIVDTFLEELSEGGKIDELILLGDVFDLWKNVPSKAIADSKYFMSGIGKIANKITYVIGNHDHHIFLMAQENKFLGGLKQSKIEDISFSPEQEFGRSVLEGLISSECNISVRYARYWKEHLGTKILFMHGHHLDGLQTSAPVIITSIDFFISWIRLLIATIRLLLAKLLKRRKLLKLGSDENFEVALASTYETLYRNAISEERVIIENGLWLIPSLFGLFWSRICKTLRFTPIQQMYFGIESYLNRLRERPGVFVYGHTHAADAYKKGKGVLAVNTGCWLLEEDPRVWKNPEQIPNTYVIIDDAITVKQLGKKEPIVPPFPMKDVATLEFGGRKSIIIQK
ncbi:MAG: metallophosphoesterase [Candidatus Bathyarchaeota archaeon]|nr:metallophosphoesterase [Candidatus Bathyarchaeota archaeon]